MEVTKQEWIDWKALPITKEFLRRLFDKREDLKEGLAEGQAEDLHNIIGQCQALKDAIEYGIEKFETIEEPIDGN